MKEGDEMNFHIEKQNDVIISERVSEVMTDFDINPTHSNELFEGSIDIEDENWNVGIIVGGSGTGKSTIAKQLFSENYISGYQYDNRSVLDNMPNNCTTKEIELAFTSVGFASPPCWLKPYHVLSTGEKMRVDLARAILSKNDMVVFDEFTSVVDRVVAKTCSVAVQKEIRRRDKKFIAVTCHKDIIEYLQPDWVYDTDQKCFFGQRGNMSSPNTKLTYTKLADLISKQYGQYLGSIII
jgi:ABC-type ATPase with predicted acetyltransferase domain